MAFPVEQIYRNRDGEVIKTSTVQEAYAIKTVRDSPRSWTISPDGEALISRTKKGIGETGGGIKSREFRFFSENHLDDALVEFDLLGAVVQA